MSLKNLNEIAIGSQNSFKKYNNEEVILSTTFKKLYTNLFHSESGERITFAKFTTLVETSSDLTITFPNQWFYIASYFVEYLVALGEYKEIYNQVFADVTDLKAVIRTIKDSGQISESINQKIESILTESNEASYFKKFLTDYSWWYGSKTIDRGDYFVSPILKLANVVNDSQSYIAGLTHKLSSDPNLLTELRSSVLLEPSKSSESSREQIISSEKSIRNFALFVFNYFYNDKWDSLISASTAKESKLNETSFNSLDYEIFKRLIGEFNSIQTKESLTTSNAIRYFEEPIISIANKYYYFSTQWNGEGDYSLSFSNLKNYFESNFSDFLLKRKDDKYLLIKLESIPDIEFDKGIFTNNLEESGLIYSQNLISRFTASLLTKPFVILTGLSGSGKTKLAQSFVQWICQDESQYRIIPVGADWTNREPLLGYPNALKPEEYVKPDNGVLNLIIQASVHPELPYFLILDEMNLSHVERYFADFLSVMESKEEIPLHAEDTVENSVPTSLRLPPNLFIIGTVNIDETTNMFSPKVLDRANTIEFRVTSKEMEDFLNNIKELDMEALDTKGANMAKSFLHLSEKRTFTTVDVESINKTLIRFFGELKKTGAEFGYRSATEILRLINQLTVLDDKLSTNDKIDIAIIQKLLPKLHGSRRKLCPVLVTLGTFCIDGEVKIEKDVFEKDNFDFKGLNVLYPMSLEKISRMYNGAIDNGFASFAEA